MRKIFIAIAAASFIVLPSANAGESVVRKADWKDSFLSSTGDTVPWLNLDSRTKLPKGDFPLGRHAEGLGRLILQPTPNFQVTFREEWSEARGL